MNFPMVFVEEEQSGTGADLLPLAAAGLISSLRDLEGHLVRLDRLRAAHARFSVQSDLRLTDELGRFGPRAR